jgi:hypothetical protein
MKARDVMTGPAITLRPGTTVPAAASLLAVHTGTCCRPTRAAGGCRRFDPFRDPFRQRDRRIDASGVLLDVRSKRVPAVVGSLG